MLRRQLGLTVSTGTTAGWIEPSPSLCPNPLTVVMELGPRDGASCPKPQQVCSGLQMGPSP